MSTHQFFITCAPFHESLLLEELKHLGITTAKETLLGVSFSGSLKDVYRVLLWSRLAHHVLLKLKDFKADNQHALYHNVSQIKWSTHLTVTQTLKVDVLGKHVNITHPHYLGQLVKDAIVDQLRKQFGTRPSVARTQADIVVTLKVKGDDCQLYLDLSGESLHLRGYRHKTGPAPIKETLAAALLMRAAWPQRLQNKDAILLDPMCGSGTILMEAALMAFDIAPGLLKTYLGIFAWQQHNAQLWQQLIEEAKARQIKGLQRSDVYLIGYDEDTKALIYANESAQRLGIANYLSLEKRSIDKLSLPEHLPKTQGLIVSNPPYGVRLLNQDPNALTHLFKTLGERLKTEAFYGWQVDLITHEREPVKALGIRMEKAYRFKNGDLDCELLQFQVNQERFWGHKT